MFLFVLIYSLFCLLFMCFYFFLLCVFHCIFFCLFILKFWSFLFCIFFFWWLFYFLFAKYKIEWCFLQLIPAPGFTQHLWCDVCFLLLEKVREGDLLEGLVAKMRAFVKILLIFVMEGGVKTQTTSIQLKLPQFSSKCLKLHQSLQWLAPGNGGNTYSICVFFPVSSVFYVFFEFYFVFCLLFSFFAFLFSFFLCLFSFWFSFYLVFSYLILMCF